MLEQFVQMLSDIDILKAQMRLILPGYLEAAQLLRHKRGRRKQEETQGDDATSAPAPVRAKYRQTAAGLASLRLNGKMHHLSKRDPLRVKTEKLRLTKGPEAALDFFTQRYVPRSKHAERRLPLAARRSQAKPKAQRADPALRTQFKSALATLSDQDRRKAMVKKRQSGIRLALDWIGTRPTIVETNS